MENFGKFMAVVLGMIFMPILNGFIFNKFWYWFMVPIFDMQPMRLVEAIGIMVLIGFIRIRYSDDDGDDFWKDYSTKMTWGLVVAAIYLLMGWIVQLFM